MREIYVADTGNNEIRRGGAPVGPDISDPAAGQTVNAGSSVVLSVQATDSLAMSFQWYLNGDPIAGATGATLSLGNVQAANAGSYQVVLGDSSGNTTASALATLAVGPPAAPAITGQPASQTVNGGGTVVFTVNGGGTVLDPALSRSGGGAPMAFTGTVYQWQFNGVNLQEGYGISGTTGPQLVIEGASVAEDGDYSCLVTTAGAAAQSDAASLLVINTANPGYLINLSARGLVGTGDNVLIGGFYIGGATSRSVLIQALGPALAAQGVAGVLQHPALTIHDSSGAVIYSNTGWGNNPVLLKAAASAYAQPVLQPGSADSEVLLTLPPGGYTAEISGADGGTGVALCAIYQLP